MIDCLAAYVERLLSRVAMLNISCCGLYKDPSCRYAGPVTASRCRMPDFSNTNRSSARDSPFFCYAPQIRRDQIRHVNLTAAHRSEVLVSYLGLNSTFNAP